MEEYKASKMAANRLRVYLKGEYGTPIVLKDKSEFEWREFIVVPFDKKLRKAFITSYEQNIHNTTAENLIQSYPDKFYTVSLNLNTNPHGRVWVDM